MVEKVKIEGLEEVRRALRQLPKDLRKKELDPALRKGANLIRDAAKMLAPRGDEAFVRQASGPDAKIKRKAWTHYIGTLRNSIAVRSEKKRYLRDSARMRIGVLSSRKDPNVGAWYWRFVEFDHVKTNGRHVPARPFLVPAFQMKKYIANEEIKKRLVLGVMKQAKRQKRIRGYAQAKGRSA